MLLRGVGWTVEEGLAVHSSSLLKLLFHLVRHHLLAQAHALTHLHGAVIVVVPMSITTRALLDILFVNLVDETALILTLERASHVITLSLSLIIFLPGLGQKLLGLLLGVARWGSLAAWMVRLVHRLIIVGNPLSILAPLHARLKEVLVKAIG